MAPAAAAVQSCAAATPAEFRSLEGTPFEKVSITADKIEFPRRNVVRLLGFTQLFRGGHRVSSDELIYYKARNKAEARGSVTLLTQKGDVVETDVLAYDIGTGMAVSGPALFSIANRPSGVLGSAESTVNAFGSAARVTFESDDIILLEEADVTSCLDGKKDVTFHADNLRVDLNEGVRTGTRVKIRIEDPAKHRKLIELERLIE
jgi:lipopolysaccharide assembly outer membrane protein LptD (OstA)